MSQERKSLSRRAFLATTAAGIVGLAAGATIGSKAFPEKMTETITKTITETRIQTTTQTSTISDVPLHEQVWSFEIPHLYQKKTL
ncbi:MAG: twin-arginine translocation signal domain-containing protein [Candidatus Bathyarchaeia archaeon]